MASPTEQQRRLANFGEGLFYYLTIVYLASPFLAFYLAYHDNHIWGIEFSAALLFHTVFLGLLFCLRGGYLNLRWLFTGLLILYLTAILLSPFFFEKVGWGRIETYFKEFEIAFRNYYIERAGLQPMFQPFAKIFVVVIEPIHLGISTLLVTVWYKILDAYFGALNQKKNSDNQN